MTPRAADLRVSIALCTCNGSRYLTEQLQSLLAQTRRADEIVICDDASTDATPQMLRDFAAASPAAVHLQLNPQRLGVTKNFESAVARCTGDIIFLCDQDDIWHRQKIEHLLPAFAEASVQLAFCDADIVSADGRPENQRLWDSIWFTPAERRRVEEGDALPVLLRHAIAAGCTLAFRSSLRPLLLPFPDLPNAHDVWITLLAACVGKLAPIREPLVRYRLHASNQVGMRRYNLPGQIRMARWQLRSGVFANLATLHGAARQRLLENQQQWPVAPAALSLLQEKITHSQIRDQMAAGLTRRLPDIWKQWRQGNYSRFSYGYKSVLQDLFLR